MIFIVPSCILRCPSGTSRFAINSAHTLCCKISIHHLIFLARLQFHLPVQELLNVKQVLLVAVPGQVIVLMFRQVILG